MEKKASSGVIGNTSDALEAKDLFQKCGQGSFRQDTHRVKLWYDRLNVCCSCLLAYYHEPRFRFSTYLACEIRGMVGAGEHI